MPRYHDRAELAPRDIVSRSIVAEMAHTAARSVFLDMTALEARFLRHRFPKIYETCLRYSLDISRDPLPVSPAAHYFMGGVRTDLEGRTTLKGLYAAGEVSCTGVHGANRLASNSLLEGLVFGARAGAAAVADFGNVSTPAETRDAATSTAVADLYSGDVALAVRKRVRRLMWERVGIIRTHETLKRALREFEQISQARLGPASRNFLTLGTLVAQAALWREESRGGHFRSDFPERDDDHWQIHSIQLAGQDISGAETIDFSSVAVEA